MFVPFVDVFCWAYMRQTEYSESTGTRIYEWNHTFAACSCVKHEFRIYGNIMWMRNASNEYSYQWKVMVPLADAFLRAVWILTLVASERLEYQGKVQLTYFTCKSWDSRSTETASAEWEIHLLSFDHSLECPILILWKYYSYRYNERFRFRICICMTELIRLHGFRLFYSLFAVSRHTVFACRFSTLAVLVAYSLFEHTTGNTDRSTLH